MCESFEMPVNYRVLAVEPSPVERRLLAAALGTIGCETTFAGSGDEALECLPDADFDLVILSSHMPDMPASTVIERIRRGCGWKSQIPVCLIYEDSEGPASRHAKAAGANACFSKPLPIAEFLSEVRGHAEVGRQMRQQSLTGWSVLEQPIYGVEDMRSPVAGANFDVTRLRPGRERGRLTHAMLGKGVFSFGAVRTDGDLRLRGDLPANAVYFATGLGAGREHPDSFWGNSLAFSAMGGVIATGAGQEFDSVHSPGLIRHAALAVPETLLYEFAQTVVPRFRRIRRPIVYQPPPQSRLKATAAFHAAIKALKDARGGWISNFDPGILVLNILTAFLMVLEGDKGLAPLPRRERKIISRVEEIVRSGDLQISLAAICLQLGEPQHAVELAFRREFDTSPAHYLRMFQLCRAREDLAGGRDSVASIAARHGFRRLSEFARRYRHTFGETPSETLATGKGGRASRGSQGAGSQTVDLLRRVLR
jgi:CheY-like chemotaxis protein